MASRLYSVFPVFLATICLFFNSCVAGEHLPSLLPSKLIFVAELCRHGDRAPIGEFPSDAMPASRWPEGVGQLTAIGQRAHYELGTRLRAKYVDTGFLSPSYSVNELYVRSTDIDRTLMSAMSQLMGLYPPGTAPNADVRVHFGEDPLHENEGGLPHMFQPIPIHTHAYTNEMVLLPGANCPRHKQLMIERYHRDEFLQKIETEAKFLQVAGRIAQVSNPAKFSIFNLQILYDTWKCCAAHSVPLPTDATPDIVSHARNLSNWLIVFSNQGLENHRLRAGLVLNTVREYMALAALREGKHRSDAVLEAKSKKFVLLSAHDTTVAATLAALRVFDGKYPPYNSTLFWQLYQRADHSLFVNLQFNGKTIVLPGCESENCTIDEYMASTGDATVFSEREREIECMTGVARYAARAMSLFSHSSKRDRTTNFGSFGDLSKAATSSSVPAIPVSVIVSAAVFCTLVALLTAWRIHSRYKGYMRPGEKKGNGRENTLAETDPLANRRILM